MKEEIKKNVQSLCLIEYNMEECNWIWVEKCKDSKGKA